MTAVGVAVLPWAGHWPVNVLWIFAFTVAGSAMLGLIGLLTAIQSDKFDQMSMITNFVITPLSFLSGTFYSVQVLPDTFRAVSHVNPFFYMIDGTRYGALGTSDANPWLGLGVIVILDVILWVWAWRWLTTGHKLKA